MELCLTLFVEQTVPVLMNSFYPSHSCSQNQGGAGGGAERVDAAGAGPQGRHEGK